MAINLTTAKILTLGILSHKEVIVRSHDSISAKHLPEIQGDASAAGITRMFLARWRANEWKIVVSVLQLGVVGVDLVDLQWNGFIVHVAFDRPS